METWCRLVFEYSDSPEPKHLAKALRAADSLIAGDLAPFEIEWLSETLLFKPINAINTIKLNKDVENWHKNIADIFKVISKIASKYWIYIEEESDKLVQICLSPFGPQIRKEAINCLISILKNPGVDVGDAVGLINALESDTTCRAPLALLVGSVCRYYPESVDQNYNRIWRIYLNMLQPKNNTDTLVSAILQGIDGLLENFGRDISIQELQHFYKDFSRRCAKIAKCIEPLLSILKSHAALFREKLVEDTVLRLYIWGLNSPNIKDALLAIYTVVFSDVSPKRIKEIIHSEIQPNINSEVSLVKHTALRIMVYARIYHDKITAEIPRPDHLEFQIRHRSISYEEADLVSLCLSSQESYVKSLLMSTIMYYDHLPVTLRLDIVVKGILEASKETRKMALTLLVELSQQDGCLDKYSDIWRKILDTENQGDEVLKETIQHFVSLLKNIIEASVKDMDQVLSLSNVLCFLLSVSETDDNSEYSDSISSVITEVAASLCVCPSEILSSKYLCIEMFKPKSILKQVMANFKNDNQKETLITLQMLFSREIADPKLLIKGLAEMDKLLKIEYNLDQRQVGEIIKNIVKLNTKNIGSTCDGRILERDLAMFIGEHEKLIEKEDFTNELYNIELKNNIFLNITNGNEGNSYKIDLLRILQISLEWGDHETLYCLLVVISASLQDRSDPGLQFVTWRCIHALLRTNGSVDVKPAVRMCVTAQCIQEALYSIREECSSEVRKRLCECVEVMLLHDPGSEDTGQLMTLVAEEMVHMIENHEGQFYLNGIDLAKVFLSTLHDNDNLTIRYLPKVLILTSRRIFKDFYKISTESFIEKIDIFEEDTVKETVFGIVRNMFRNNNRIQLELILDFLKKILDVKYFGEEYIISDIFKAMDNSKNIINSTGNIVDLETYTNVLQILAICKSIFSFDDATSKSVVLNDFVNIENIVEKLNTNIDTNILRNVLKFLKEYAVELMKIKGPETITCFGKLIESVKPESVPTLKNDLSVCLNVFETIHKEFSTEIIYSYVKWYDKLNIKEITESFYNTDDMFAVSDTLNKFSDSIHSLSIMSKIFDCRISEAAVWTSLLMKNDKNLRMTIVSDMLSISENCLSLSEFGNMLQNHLPFIQKYLNVYLVKYFLSESIVCEEIYFPLFADAVKIFIENYKSYEQYYDAVIRIFDKIWPRYESMGFENQLSVASDLFRQPRTRMIPTLVQWVKDTITAETTSLNNKIRLIIILPGGEEYSACYRCMAGCLPIHLSEVKGTYSAVLRCLLDSLAASGDLTLLDIIITIAAADDNKGWWDDAIDACMASLADRRDQKIFDAAYRACKMRTGLGGCRRVFVPLLKHSTRIYCEEYTCGIVKDVLDIIRTGFKEPYNSEVYREKLLSYAKAFSILQVIIEKVPAKNLESGIINMSAGYQVPWCFVKDVCMYSMTLRNKVRCPDNATDAIKDACLRAQCSAYNCLVAAICKRRPSQRQYTAVFDVSAWCKVVDPSVQYEFPPRAVWSQGRSRSSSDTSTAATSSTFTGTVRTRMFMATLSENPLEYDMIPNNEDEEEVEEDRQEPYENHPLNCLGVLSSITELLVHSSTLQHTEWLGIITSGLTSLHVNGKWTIAQAICNAASDLKPHASTLAPALLAVVASTPTSICDRRVLNNLHIDILWTIIRWEAELSRNDDLNSCIEFLISSCVEYRSRDAVVRRLLNTLNSLLQMYKDNIDIKWSFLQTYCNELPPNASYLLPILQRILKNAIRLPGLLTIYNRFEARHWMSISKLPDVFGLALSLEGNKEEYLGKFHQVLDSVKVINVGTFVKILLYVQRVCWQACNLRYIRIIADLATKVEKSKCLQIICIYLENLEVDDGFCQEMLHIIGLNELLDGDLVVEAMKVVQAGLKYMEPNMKNETVAIIIANCRNSSAKIRKQAYSVVLKVFQDLMLTKVDHSAKRRAVDTTPIIDSIITQTHHHIIEVLSAGVFDDDEISNMVLDGIEECLSKEISIRFAELFYIIFYFGKNDFCQLSEYGFVFLDLLFRDMKRQEIFKNKTLSDRPLPSDADTLYTTLMTGAPRTIDVQMPVADIFEVFLQSAKKNSEICQELIVELMKRLQGTSLRFDLDSTIATLLKDLLKKEPCSLTPLYIEASRIFLNNVASIDGFKDTLKILRSKVMSSDSLVYFNILYEDLLLKTDGRSLFNFGIKEEFDVEMRNGDDQFSIEGLVDVFGNLSNWDDLRIQDRSRMEECLPTLLVEKEEFESSLKEYFDKRQPLDYGLWFNKMVGVYCSNKLGKPMVQYKEYWLKDSERWPTREFVTSAVIEAIQWSPSDAELLSCDIKRSECLAEWAARLMLRSSYFDDDPRKTAMCRGDELKWCIEANRRGLPNLAVQCIERNKNMLLEDEAVAWFHEKVVARRTIALRLNDTDVLKKALDITEGENTGTDICLQKLILQLHNDLGTLSVKKLEETLSSIKNSVSTDMSKNNLDTLKCVYDMAMNHYDDMWVTDDSHTKLDIVSNMVDAVQTKLFYNIYNDYNLLISILFNKLMNFDGILTEDVARKVLHLISSIIPHLDTYSIEVLKSITKIFPVDVPMTYGDTSGDQSLQLCKQYLQMIRDPQYALLQYCSNLFYAKDQNSYETIFIDMKRNLFANTFSSTDYRSLNTMKNKLFAIERIDNIVARNRVLKNIMDELKSKPQRSVLRLSQLTPELSKPSVLDKQRNNLQMLLALPSSVHVVKFLEQIQVFRDSIRRPCVLSAVLSNGITKRYIIKTGEPLSNDASVQRAIAILPKLFDGQVNSYKVTILTEDAAIIEYLEDHVRLRELMGDAVNVPINQRLADDKLVLSPSLALEQYQELSNEVPVHILRSSIENKCASVQEFIFKKLKFMSTLCSMTITNWLFGVGDRHLQNIMMDRKDGGVCGVDWASTFQYGLRECVPARLTPCVLAVCDVTVLESRLQSMLLCLRENRRLYEAFIKISFYWQHGDFKAMTYIRNILSGNSVSYEVTKAVLEESNIKLKEDYIKVLSSVFEDFTKKDSYSVEEQITCLLKHCTDTKLLSITPQGWEGWL